MQNFFKFSSLLTLHVMIYATFPRITAEGDYYYFSQKGDNNSQNDLNSLSGFTILCKVVVEIIFNP